MIPPLNKQAPPTERCSCGQGRKGIYEGVKMFYCGYQVTTDGRVIEECPRNVCPRCQSRMDGSQCVNMGCE